MIIKGSLFLLVKVKIVSATNGLETNQSPHYNTVNGVCRSPTSYQPAVWD